MDITEEQIVEKLPEFRAAFEEKFKGQIADGSYDAADVERFRADDAYASCFLRSFTEKDKTMDFTLEKSDKVFLFRKELGLNALKADSFPKEITERGFLYWKGENVEKHKILLFSVVKAKKGFMVEDTKKYIAWHLDEYQKANPGVRIVLIFDFTGAGVSNVDLDIVKYIISCFSNYFPSLLSYILLFEMPLLLSAVWKIINSWLSEDQKKKIRLVKKKDISEYVAADQLEPHMVKK